MANKVFIETSGVKVAPITMSDAVAVPTGVGGATKNEILSDTLTRLNTKDSGAYIYRPLIDTERWDVSAISYRDGTVTIVTDSTHTNTLAVDDKVALVPKFLYAKTKYDYVNGINLDISGVYHYNRLGGFAFGAITAITDNVITIANYVHDVDTTLVPAVWTLQRIKGPYSTLISLPEDIKGKPFSVEIISKGTNIRNNWFIETPNPFFGKKPGILFNGDRGLYAPTQWEKWDFYDGFTIFHNLIYENYLGKYISTANYAKSICELVYCYPNIDKIDGILIPDQYCYYGQFIKIKAI